MSEPEMRNPGTRCNAAGEEFRIDLSLPNDAPQSGTLASLFYYDRQSGSVERLSQLRAVLA